MRARADLLVCQDFGQFYEGSDMVLGTEGFSGTFSTKVQEALPGR